MALLTLEAIVAATSGRILSRYAETFHGVSIDSRTIGEGELFVALRGERFDGHDFVGEALKRGSGAIVSEILRAPVSERTLIQVEDTLRALQEIARARRQARDVTVVGITGTNGKTSTKEMICSIARHRGPVLCSSGNFNNQIGLPLNLLKLNGEGLCVLEMGASRRGDIRELCEISLPDYGVITNIGPAHLEGFGSIEAVRDTKLELMDFAKVIALNGDDDMLRTVVKGVTQRPSRSILTFGIKRDAQVMARNVVLGDLAASGSARTSFDLHIGGRMAARVQMRVPGIFNVYNALAAAAIADALEVPPDVTAAGLEEFQGVPMRLELKRSRGALVISDMYNANPASMDEALKELVRMKGRRAIVVLGDMLELGAYAETAHRTLGSALVDLPVEVFIGVGPLMRAAVEEFSSRANSSRSAYCFDDAPGAREALGRILSEGDTVLVKGSRAMRMEQIVEDAKCST
ncbi:MAG: UDP-N-acetylmuramoyl-tripeptide--D-alanyl-D-alanine ligase [Thermodesulfovibrionales bacterium]